MTQFVIRHNIKSDRYFVVQANIVRFTELLRVAVDEDNRRTLLSLLAEEKVKLRALSSRETEEKRRKCAACEPLMANLPDQNDSEAGEA